jgi:hypothetical protein
MHRHGIQAWSAIGGPAQCHFVINTVSALTGTPATYVRLVTVDLRN